MYIQLCHAFGIVWTPDPSDRVRKSLKGLGSNLVRKCCAEMLRLFYPVDLVFSSSTGQVLLQISIFPSCTIISYNISCNHETANLQIIVYLKKI